MDKLFIIRVSRLSTSVDIVDVVYIRYFVDNFVDNLFGTLDYQGFLLFCYFTIHDSYVKCNLIFLVTNGRFFVKKNKNILGRGSVLIIYTSIAVKRVWLQFFKNSIIRDNHDIILILFSCYTLLQFWFWNCNTFLRSLCNLYSFLFLFTMNVYILYKEKIGLFWDQFWAH